MKCSSYNGKQEISNSTMLKGSWSECMEGMKVLRNRAAWKKLFKKNIVLSMCAALLLNCGACTGYKEKQEMVQSGESAQLTGTQQLPTSVPVETTPSAKAFLPTTDYVKYLGRATEVENTLWLVHSGTGMEFSFTGTSANIKIKPDSSFMNRNNQARIAIYVNGERVVDDMVDKLEKVYTVAESENVEEYTVRVVKLSEAAYSTVGITGIEVTSIGDIQPTKASDKYIEFIGDSITCGYGVDDEDASHHFSTTTEDATKTYAYKTAEKLGADYSLVSFSGYGIISGYSGDGNKVPEQTLPQYYDKLGNTGGTYLAACVAQEMGWDFTKRQPDIVVINLGTNDNSYTKNQSDRKEEYTVAYVEFLKQVREKNPDAMILCTLGIMGAELYPCVEDAVELYTKETGDAKVDTMKFDTQSMLDGIAADWHPTEKTHEKAAEKLAVKIKESMGW